MQQKGNYDDDVHRPNKLNRLDTLRAMAVIIVVAFHMQPAFIPWGYIGVDMFFTLSGFLMSYLYFQKQSSIRTNLVKDFIVRRFWRLFPPFVLVNLITVIIAILIMAPSHLIETAKSGASSIFLFSNFYFHSQSGYFDTDAIVKPLLHTWSLGVEEQFYILFALALAVTRWLSLKNTLLILTAVSVTAWCVVVMGELNEAIQPIHDKPYSSLFFLPQYRIFQFSIGGLAAYAMLSGYRGWSGVGFVVLLTGVLIASNKLYAHLSAPIVTFGMAILMVSPSLLDAAGKFEIVRYFARISYQLYLTHWPIIVFWQYITFSELTLPETIICSLICVISADLLYRSTNWMRRR